MAEFITKFANDRGEVLEQLERGDSEEEVRTRYAQQGYFVYSVKAKGAFALRKLSLNSLEVRTVKPKKWSKG